MDADSKISSFMTLTFALLYWYCMTRMSKGFFVRRVSSVSSKLQASHEFSGVSRFVQESLRFARLRTWGGTCTWYGAGLYRWASLGHETELSLVLRYLRHIVVCYFRWAFRKLYSTSDSVSWTGFIWQLWAQETKFWSIFPASTEEMDLVSHYIVSIDL